MELYNSKYVYFEWDKELDGKKGFVAQNIASLRSQVYDNPKTMVTLSSSDDDVCPFTYYNDGEITCDYQFAYYDPYYEFRKAYLEGKQLQFKTDNGDWQDVEGEPIFTRDEYRIKPEETRWYVTIDEYGLSRTNSIGSGEYVLFEGSEEECDKWVSEHDKFNPVMIAYYLLNKPVQKFSYDFNAYVDVTNPDWNPTDEYIIKDEYEPFDTVRELIDAWDKKHPSNMNRPDDTMPLIWIKQKVRNRVFLITSFLFDRYCGYDVSTDTEGFKLNELFEDYTFLDGSIIGKEIK